MIRLILITILIMLFAIYSIIDAIIVSFISINDKKLAKSISEKAVKILFHLMIFFSGAKLHIKGLENIDEKKPLFIISNHRGFFDIIIGYTFLKKSCGFVAKNSFEKIPFMNYWMKKIGCLFIDRANLRSGAEMVINAIKSLENGTSIWLCPEGTRNKNKDPLELLEFKSGAFKIAEKTDALVLPVAFYGTEDVFERQKPFIKSADIYVSIGKNYKISSLSEQERQNIGEYNKNLIKDLLIGIINEKK